MQNFSPVKDGNGVLKFKVQKALKNAVEVLEKNSSSPILDAELLLSHILKVSHEKLLATLDQEISKKQQKRFEKIIKRRKEGVPMAYLLGCKEFFGYEIKVTPDVLIPRPETETILEFAIGEIKKTKKEKILIADIGTGSGGISLVMSKAFPKSKIIATDISKKALKVAAINLKTHKIRNVKLTQSDLLENIKKQKFDVVVSNLPYLSEKVYHKVQAEVKKEPKPALVAKEDGMAFYYRLVRTLKPFVKNNSLIFLEIDPHQYESLKKKISECFPNSRTLPIKSLSNKKEAIIGLYSHL